VNIYLWTWGIVAFIIELSRIVTYMKLVWRVDNRLPINKIESRWDADIFGSIKTIIWGDVHGGVTTGNGTFKPRSFLSFFWRSLLISIFWPGDVIIPIIKKVVKLIFQSTLYDKICIYLFCNKQERKDLKEMRVAKVLGVKGYASGIWSTHTTHTTHIT